MSGNGNGKMDERTERRVNLAQERNARVVFANTGDTHRMLNVLQGLDRGMKKLRANAFTQYPVEEVLPLFQEYQSVLSDLNELAHKVCTYTGVKYRQPAGMEAPGEATEFSLPEAQA